MADFGDVKMSNQQLLSSHVVGLILSEMLIPNRSNPLLLSPFLAGSTLEWLLEAGFIARFPSQSQSQFLFQSQLMHRMFKFELDGVLKEMTT